MCPFPLLTVAPCGSDIPQGVGVFQCILAVVVGEWGGRDNDSDFYSTHPPAHHHHFLGKTYLIRGPGFIQFSCLPSIICCLLAYKHLHNRLAMTYKCARQTTGSGKFPSHYRKWPRSECGGRIRHVARESEQPV